MRGALIIGRTIQHGVLRRYFNVIPCIAFSGKFKYIKRTRTFFNLYTDIIIFMIKNTAGTKIR